MCIIILLEFASFSFIDKQFGHRNPIEKVLYGFLFHLVLQYFNPFTVCVTTTKQEKTGSTFRVGRERLIDPTYDRGRAGIV